MASTYEWFWCRGCHRAFKAEVWRPAPAGHSEEAGRAFSDIQGAVVCPFRGCGAMHVTPWAVMCRRYEARFGVSYPQPPAEGERFEMLAMRQHAGSRRTRQPVRSADLSGPKEASLA